MVGGTHCGGEHKVEGTAAEPGSFLLTPGDYQTGLKEVRVGEKTQDPLLGFYFFHLDPAG